MNDPKKLNGWTGNMMLTLRDRFQQHAKDPETKVLILTSAGLWPSCPNPIIYNSRVFSSRGFLVS